MVFLYDQWHFIWVFCMSFLGPLHSFLYRVHLFEDVNFRWNINIWAPISKGKHTRILFLWIRKWLFWSTRLLFPFFWFLIYLFNFIRHLLLLWLFRYWVRLLDIRLLFFFAYCLIFCIHWGIIILKLQWYMHFTISSKFDSF